MGAGHHQQKGGEARQPLQPGQGIGPKSGQDEGAVRHGPLVYLIPAFLAEKLGFFRGLAG
jgi:hypothetical protein